MSADDKDTAEAEGAEKPRGGKKKLIIIIAAVLLLVGGGAGAYFAGLFGGEKKEGEEHAAEEEHAEEEHAEEAPAEEEHAAAEEGEGEHGEKKGEGEGKGGEKYTDKGDPNSLFYALPEFLVNLNSNTGQSNYIKMKVSLVLETAEDREKVTLNMPVLQDMFNTYLRDLRPSDLSGSAGIYRLREELIARSNKSLAPVRVKNILFEQIMVQ